MGVGRPERTAHRCVFADGSVDGKVVVVTGGAGAVGGFAVSFAKWAGARVIATVGSEEQTKLALDAGAEHALNYRTQDVAESIHEITGGEGADRIVEVAFGKNLSIDAEAVAPHGTIVAYASDADSEPRLTFWPLLFKNATIRLVGSDELPEEAQCRAVADTSACLGAGLLRPRVAQRFPLEKIAEAHESVDSGRAGGQVVLDIA